MDTTKEIPSFNLYEYKGSPNVSVLDGYMATLCGFCLFSAINYAAIKLGPPSSLKGDVWRWRNTFVSWVHAVIVGTGVLYWYMYLSFKEHFNWKLGPAVYKTRNLATKYPMVDE